MLELPEVLARGAELDRAAAGKVVADVLPPTSPHKFCWITPEAGAWNALLSGRSVIGAAGFGIFVELTFSGGQKLCFNDGVNVRLLPPGAVRPPKYQLLLGFTDGSVLVFTVAMYGGITCHSGESGDKYYRASRDGLSPLDSGFDRVQFDAILNSVRPTMSVKAALATEQRIPGLGNGVLQDILLHAGVHPKRKVGSLSAPEREALYRAVKTVLADMARLGGRDTERDIFGNPGRYRTLLSKNTLQDGCPKCGGPVTKETYLGGAVYYCSSCQPLP